jgi:hypothetical protein
MFTVCQINVCWTYVYWANESLEFALVQVPSRKRSTLLLMIKHMYVMPNKTFYGIHGLNFLAYQPKSP